MGRVAWRIRAAVALTLLAVALPALGAGPGDGRPGKSASEAAVRKKGPHTLGEVRIYGSAEQPGALFFLPRAKFRLLPHRNGRDWKNSLLIDDKILADAP